LQASTQISNATESLASAPLSKMYHLVYNIPNRKASPCKPKADDHRKRDKKTVSQKAEERRTTGAFIYTAELHYLKRTPILDEIGIQHPMV
jgi:hypothetical protein